MAKKRRKPRRKKAHNPKRKSHRRKKRRAVASNPRRRSHRRAHRARKSNPRRRRRHTAHAAPRRRRRHRFVASNPRRRRRHKRNPKLGTLMPYLLAGGAALASFALVSAGSYVLSGKIDGYKSIDRDRYLIAGGAGLLGLYLALKKKKPLLGAAVAGGAVISAVGIKATEMVSKLLQPKAPPTMSAVFGQDMSGYNRMQGYERIGDYERLAAVYGQDMSAVYGQDMAGIGELPPGPPWASPSPF